MAITFIDQTGAPVKNIVRFKDTSIRLNTAINLYCISDEQLTSLNASYVNDSNFSFYSLARQTYTIAVTGSANATDNIDLQHVSFNVTDGMTSEQVAILIETKLNANNRYDSVVRDGSNLSFRNVSRGTQPDGEFVDDDLNVFGLSFDISISNNASNIEQSDSLELDDLQYSVQGSKHIYKLNLLFRPTIDTGVQESETSWQHSNTLNITVGAEQFSYTIEGYGIAIDERLTVLLQNFKSDITKYYTAFRKSNHNEPIRDNILVNTKMKEYLIQLYEITGFVGSYRSLLSALEFFGYGDLLRLKEMWKNMYTDDRPSSNQTGYKFTNIANHVLYNIDKQLAGFKKTNQMALVYDINVDSGTFDENGLPNYTNIFYNTDEILIKLFALRDILEQDFLPLNTKITDIIGEHTSVVGIETILWEDNARFETNDLTENIVVNIDHNVVYTDVEVANHEVFVSAWVLETDNVTTEDDLRFKDARLAMTNSTAYYTDLFFEIDELIDREQNQATDYDVLTRFVSVDCGIIEVSITFPSDVVPSSLFHEYDFVVTDNTGVEVFRSERHTMSRFTGSIRAGVRKLGTYRMLVNLYDHYGGIVLLGSSTDITIRNAFSDFTLYRTVNNNQTTIQKDLILQSTYRVQSHVAGTDIVNIDPIDEGNTHTIPSPNLNYDIYTGQDRTTSLQHAIAYYTTGSIQNKSIYRSANAFAGIPISDMTNVPIQTYGYLYGTYLIDLIGDGTEGNRSISLKRKDITDRGYETISIFHGSESDFTFIRNAIEQLNSTPGLFNLFTFSVNMFSLSNDISDVVPMIRMTAKDLSMTDSMIETIVSNASSVQRLDDNAYVYHEIESVLPYDAGFELIFDTNAMIGFDNTLTITVGVTDYTVNANVTTKTALITAIKNLIASNELPVQVFDSDASSNRFVMTSNNTLAVKHRTVGLNRDVPRGFVGSNLYSFAAGDNLIRTETMLAIPDTKSKIDNRDISWSLTNALTNEVIETQNSYAFRYVFTEKGSYSLQMLSTDIYGRNERIKRGCVLI